MSKESIDFSALRPKILLVGVHAPYNKTASISSYYEEFLNLVRSNGTPYDETIFLKIRAIDPGTFLTKGNLEKVRELVEKHDIEEIIFSEPLTPQQERNLANYLSCRIFDRTQLILEIFEKAAHSAEGKMQVEIAMHEYQKTRLAGKGVGLAQQTGIFGLRGGAGETLKEKERRHIEKRILALRKQLKQLQQTRATQRKRRLKSDVPLICLVGYTNAGKSTILNALTKSDVLAEDRLFATLDTTTRELYLNGKKRGLISDTVGFIQMLPPHLIEAFKSTLSELEYADLLLHVIDLSDPNWQSHVAVVHHILYDLGVDKDVLYVFNKTDQVTVDEMVEKAVSEYQPHVLVSAQSKKGLAPLIVYLEEHLPKPQPTY